MTDKNEFRYTFCKKNENFLQAIWKDQIEQVHWVNTALIDVCLK